MNLKNVILSKRRQVHSKQYDSYEFNKQINGSVIKVRIVALGDIKKGQARKQYWNNRVHLYH